MRQILMQGMRFLFVGGIAVGVDFVVYFGLSSIAPAIPIPVAKAISYISGTVVSFVGHRSFVFKAQDRHPRQQILPFVILYTSSLVANNLVNQIILSMTHIKVLAWFIAICTSTTINYLGMKFAVFKKSSIDSVSV